MPIGRNLNLVNKTHRTDFVKLVLDIASKLPKRANSKIPNEPISILDEGAKVSTFLRELKRDVKNASKKKIW